MNYEQLKKDAHTLYLHGHLTQWMALNVMGLKPSQRWIITKCHQGVQYLITALMKDLGKLDKLKETKDEVQKETR